MRTVWKRITSGQFNKEAKILCNTVKLNEEFIKRIMHYDQVGFILVMRKMVCSSHEMQKRCLIKFNIHSWFQNEKLLSKLGIKAKLLNLKKMMCHSIKAEDSSVHKCWLADFVSVKESISQDLLGAVTASRGVSLMTGISRTTVSRRRKWFWQALWYSSNLINMHRLLFMHFNSSNKYLLNTKEEQNVKHIVH